MEIGFEPSRLCSRLLQRPG